VRTLVLILTAVLIPASRAQSVYHVEVDTTRVEGSAGRVSFDLISNRLRTNRVDVFNFSTDGEMAAPETRGGLISGDLIDRDNPAKLTRIRGNEFRNELAVVFASFGKKVTFSVNVSESAPEPGQIPDQFSLSVLDAQGNPLRQAAAGEAKGDPNFAVIITGERGGQLEVYGRQVDRRIRGRIDGIDANGSPLVGLTITPAWISEEEENSLPIVIFHGGVEEFCTRRCVGEPNCEGGEFGIMDSEDNFYRFDDVGNLKARVAVIERGREPAGLKARVTGSLLNKTVLRVREIVFLD